MSARMSGKIALVTGAGMGIGRASALAFAREGAKVVVSDINSDTGKETVSLIKEAGGEAVFVKADVSKSDEVQALINKTVETYGRLDYAHNNAGISGTPATPTADCTEENWDNVMNINLKGTWFCMKHEIPVMLKNGGGAIVNTASKAGLIGAGHGVPAYVASKHAVVGLTKAAALEYAKKGIRVNAVCPGIVLTELVQRFWDADPEVKEHAADDIPMGRLASPEEIAESVIWLSSDSASFVTGHALAIDGGTVAQ